jgi:formylmethanofuran dehydrogenase subunit E-like metal-binding protein
MLSLHLKQLGCLVHKGNMVFMTLKLHKITLHSMKFFNQETLIAVSGYKFTKLENFTYTILVSESYRGKMET